MTFDKRARPCTPGPAPARFVSGRRPVASAIGTPRGKLRVNAPVFGSTLLVPMVTNYLRRYPEVEVDLVLEDRQADLVKDRFEVMFRIGALSDSDLIARTLRPFELTICASPGYLAERGMPAMLRICPSMQCGWLGHRGATRLRDRARHSQPCAPALREWATNRGVIPLSGGEPPHAPPLRRVARRRTCAKHDRRHDLCTHGRFGARGNQRERCRARRIDGCGRAATAETPERTPTAP